MPGAFTLGSNLEPATKEQEDAESLAVKIGGRSFAEIYYSVEEDTEIVIYTANEDEEDKYRELDRFDTTESGTETEANVQFPWLAREYLKVEFTDTSGHIDIAASR